MSKYSREDVLRLIEEEDIEFIRLQFTDIFGNLKNVAVTSSQIERVLDNKVEFDGSSIEGFARVEESDMLLYPDLDTFVIFPWRPQQGKVARFLCDIHYPDGRIFEGSPRSVLKKVVEDARKKGYTLQVGPECEFFLFNISADGKPTLDTEDTGGYFDVAPIDLGENARRDMVLSLEEMGYEVEASHHECSPAQHEIDLKYDDALCAADGIVTFKLAVRTIAKKYGFHASFMPKPQKDVEGSGMHINMSVMKDGKNIFDDPDGKLGLSEDAYHFIAGIMEHMNEIIAVTNPVINSYKRIVPGYEVPCYNTWSATSRAMNVRVPSARGESARIELRTPDGASNPYLAIALCLAAGLDGIERKLVAPESVNTNLLEKTAEEIEEMGVKALPASLYEAVINMKNSEFVKGVLGEHIFKKFIDAKMKEWSEYSTQITQWELDRYLGQI